MKSFLRKILACVATLATFTSACLIPAQAKNNSKGIGMVSSAIPYIYVETLSTATKDTTVTVDGTQRTVVSTQSDKDAVKYTHILIDNSLSMTTNAYTKPGSFNSLKAGVNALINTASANNVFVVYKIGKTGYKKLGTVYSREDAKVVSKKVNSLRGDESGTYLYTTFDKFISTVSRPEGAISKVILITDGAGDDNSTEDQKTLSAFDKYSYNSLPVSVVYSTVSTNSDSYYAKLLTKCEESGGTVKRYTKTSSADGKVALTSLYKSMYSGTLVKVDLKDGSVKADNSTHEIAIGSDRETVLFDSASGAQGEIVAKVSVRKNKDSYEFLVNYTLNGETVILDSDTAENSQNYLITKSGSDKRFTVSSVSRSGEDYVVKMKKDIFTGSYDFAFKNITDNSAAKNSVSNITGLQLKAKSPFFKVLPYLISVVALAVVLLAFYLILLGLKKKKNVKTIRELFETQVEETVEEKVYIANKQKPVGRKVTFYSQTGSYPQRKTTVSLKSSIIVGRSNICDIYIDDSKLSRQHFAIEHDSGVFMITDLESSNGTFLNGIRIRSRQVIKSGDMITAGLTKLRIEL